MFIAIPTHNGWIHGNAVAGILQLFIALPNKCQVEKLGGSFLPMQRDQLTRRFLHSNAEWLLCLDADVGFTAEDVIALLATKKDFVSGTYVKKQPDRQIPAKTVSPANVIGPLAECEHVPAGFMLVHRTVIERMIGAYAKLAYGTPSGTQWALWHPTFTLETGYDGEDVAFCRRWRAIGGQIWLHTGVVLTHFGEHGYLPLSPEAERVRVEAEAANKG